MSTGHGGRNRLAAGEKFDRDGVQGSADELQAARLSFAPDAATPGRGWGIGGERMAEVCATTPSTIGQVLGMLTRTQEILDVLPPEGAFRVASFNSLYYTITNRVAQSLSGPEVTDPAFLELLDVEFAKRYFLALRLWGELGVRAPEAWEILFRRGDDLGISRLAAAMLGVNAHINHDLALALLATWENLGTGPGEDVHPDYLLINKIFYREIPRLRRRYSWRWHLRVDMMVGKLDDWSQCMLVLATRNAAWEQAERLWEVRDVDADLARAVLLMDRVSAYLGEAVVFGDLSANKVVGVLRGGRDRARVIMRRPRHTSVAYRRIGQL